jgi:hypothetical protein
VAPGNYSVFVMNRQYSIIGKLAAIGAKIIGQSIQISGSTPIQLNIELPRTLSKINGTALRNGKPFAGAMIVCLPQNPENNLPLFRGVIKATATVLLRCPMCYPVDIGSWQSKTAGISSGAMLRFSNLGSNMLTA